MKHMPIPVPLVLDLWAIGHSATDIAAKLGLSSRQQVARILTNARKLGDPRAVLHVGKTGRLLGRPGRMATPPACEVTSSLRAQVCSRGHPQGIPKLTYSNGNCIACCRIRDHKRDRRVRK